MKRIAAIITILLSAAASAIAAPTQPQYPGGESAMKKFIADNMQYPAPARQNGIEGIVNLSVTVKADGSIGTIKIKRMIDPDLEQEAIRIVKMMPAWQPATDGGTPVDSTAELSVPFLLGDE